MSKALNAIAAIMMLSVAATGSARAAPAFSHGYDAAHPTYLGPLPGYVPQQPMTPQFNEPGPQIKVPQPTNPVEQLPPLFGAGQPDALGLK